MFSSNLHTAAGAAGIAVLTLLTPQVNAQNANDYPARPVRLIVGYGAGGSLDAMARVIAQELQKGLKQSFIVENVAGAGGAIGVKRVVDATPDGHTLLMGITSDVALAPYTNKQVKYKPSDLAPVIKIGTSGIAIIGSPGLQANNFADLIKLARAKPGSMSYGTSGTGSLQHLAMESVKLQARVDIPFVSYKSASQITGDLAGNHIELAVVGLPAVLPMIETNKIKGLAVLSKERDIGNKNIPSVSELAGMEAIDFNLWTGMFAPKGTPPAIVAKLHAAVESVLKQPAVIEQYKKMGVKIAEAHSSADFARFVNQEEKKLQNALKESRIELE
jgi:tripartite-type tricarboxylate transporter receptor subunit TctC